MLVFIIVDKNKDPLNYMIKADQQGTNIIRFIVRYFLSSLSDKYVCNEL